MTGSAFDVPVAVFVFNRPEFVRRVMQSLAEVRPRTLLVVADGPRPTVPTDEARCAESRSIASTPSWPCEVITHWSDRNLGCDRRLRSGLDWVFSTVDRAVINEDDVLAHPSFFSWCAHQLDRYDGAADIHMVAGHNTMGRWPTRDGADHLIVRRGSIHGWATWSDAWHRTDHDLSTVDHAGVDQLLLALDGDPLALDHSALLTRFARRGRLGAWDARWSLANLLADRWAVIPPVNLTANIGYGDGATRTTNPDDIRPATPTFAAPLPVATDRPPASVDYDRMSLLLELLATYRRPEATVRLARHRSLLRDGDGPDEWALAHLVPLDHLDDSITALRHLRSVVGEHHALDHLLTVLDGIADAQGPT